jgi:hypothetical protein
VRVIVFTGLGLGVGSAFFMINDIKNYFFLAVFFDCANAFAVGAPLLPTFLIFSPDPSAIRFRLA